MRIVAMASHASFACHHILLWIDTTLLDGNPEVARLELDFIIITQSNELLLVSTGNVILSPTSWTTLWITVVPSLAPLAMPSSTLPPAIATGSDATCWKLP
jgi:hypothetical protein